jgi:uncharacterized membrane protein YphA (DoxX/SURF4 family)
MQSFFGTSPFYLDKTLAILRIALGLLLIYHGREVLYPEMMKGYFDWEPFKGPNGAFLAYLGKGAELVSGILLTLGLLTRVGALICRYAGLCYFFHRTWQVLVRRPASLYVCVVWGVVFVQWSRRLESGWIVV